MLVHLTKALICSVPLLPIVDYYEEGFLSLFLYFVGVFIAFSIFCSVLSFFIIYTFPSYFVGGFRYICDIFVASASTVAGVVCYNNHHIVFLLFFCCISMVSFI